MDPRLQGYKDSIIQGYNNIGHKIHKDTRMVGYKDTRIQRW